MTPVPLGAMVMALPATPGWHALMPTKAPAASEEPESVKVAALAAMTLGGTSRPEGHENVAVPLNEKRRAKRRTAFETASAETKRERPGIALMAAASAVASAASLPEMSKLPRLPPLTRVAGVPFVAVKR